MEKDKNKQKEFDFEKEKHTLQINVADLDKQLQSLERDLMKRGRELREVNLEKEKSIREGVENVKEKKKYKI